MLNALRSELTRSRRPGVLGGWFGLTALLTVLIVVVTFQLTADPAQRPTAGPGVTFPTLATLESPDGIMAPLASAASMFGVVTLAFWAVLTATDHSTGLVRLLVAAQPRRWKLVAGKVGALAIWTAAAATVAVLVGLVATPAVAGSSGLDLSAWGTDLVAVVSRAWLQLYLALVVWGMIGLVLAVVTRSAAVAVSVGAGWVLVVESVLTAAFEGLRDWLPGTTISALAAGGNAAVPAGSALALGAGYVAACLVTTLVVFARRDITD
jgi:ABC-2 type transport system permease protein